MLMKLKIKTKLPEIKELTTPLTGVHPGLLFTQFHMSISFEIDIATC